MYWDRPQRRRTWDWYRFGHLLTLQWDVSHYQIKGDGARVVYELGIMDRSAWLSWARRGVKVQWTVVLR